MCIWPINPIPTPPKFCSRTSPVRCLNGEIETLVSEYYYLTRTATPMLDLAQPVHHGTGGGGDGAAATRSNTFDHHWPGLISIKINKTQVRV